MINKIISVIFAIALIFSVNSNIFVIHIEIPLGDIPFPYLFWILVFFYTAFCFKVLKLPLNISFIYRSVLFGIFFHIILLLLKLRNEESIGIITFASNVYKLYFKFFTAFIFSFFTAFIAYRIFKTKSYQNQEIIESIYDWPLLGLCLYLFLSTFNQKQYGDLFLYVSIFMVMALITVKKDYLEKLKIILLKSKEFILRPKIFLSLIFFSAMSIRVIYLLRTMTNPNYLLTGADAGNYDKFARIFLAHGLPAIGSISLNEVWSWIAHMGYWQYLAFFYKVFDYSYFAFCFIQSILGAMACIFVYFIGKHIFNETVARISAIVSVFNFSMIFSSIVIDTMGLNIFCITLVIFLLCRYQKNLIDGKKLILLFASIGMITGFLIMTFYTNLIFLIMIATWVFLLDLKKLNFKKALIHSSFIILFSLIAISINLYIFGLSSLKSYILLLLSNSSDTTRFYSGYFSEESIRFPEMVSLGLGSAAEIVLYSIPVIIEKGFPALKIIFSFLITSISELFFAQGYGGFDPLFLVRLSEYSSVLWFYTYILTIFGIVISIFKSKLYQNSSVTLLLYLYIVSTALIHILFFRAEYRYRSLMEPYLIMFGAFGLWNSFKSAKDEWKNV